MYLRRSFPFSSFPSDLVRSSLPRVAALVACAVWAPSLFADPTTTLPFYGGLDTDRFFHLELKDGTTFLNDDLEDTPIRSRRMQQNPFREIGRPADQPGFPGEILLGPIRNPDGGLRAVLFVETSTGYVAFFDDPGSSSKLGEISVAVGRPFEGMASNDGNFALVMRRDRSGRTEGAYLVHGATGKVTYLDGLRKFEDDTPITAATSLPEMQGKIAVAALQSSREETVGFLVADSGDGALYYVDVNDRRPTELSQRRLPLSLFDALPQDATHSVYTRLLAVPIQDGNASTRHVLFLDVGTGAMALLENLDQRPALVLLGRNLYDTFDAETATPRSWSAAPHIEDDETVGLWVVDNLEGALLYVGNPSTPGGVTVQSRGRVGR